MKSNDIQLTTQANKQQDIPNPNTIPSEIQFNTNLVNKIYTQYFTQIKFKQIDYIVGKALPGMLNSAQNKQLIDIICLIDDCLVITQKGFDILYNNLLKIVINDKQQWGFKNKAADILICMNGQNDKAYNFKKKALQQMTHKQKWQINQEIGKLDLNRQLAINGAVIMKFKKTSSCYQYRIKLMEHKLSTQNIDTIHQQQHNLAKKILQRFPRNYFCWMYRLRLFKLMLTIRNTYQLNLSELRMVHQLLQKYPNDYSILSYYRFLIRNNKQNQNYPQFVKYTLQNCTKLIQFCKIAYESQNQYKRLTQFVQQLNHNIEHI